MKGSRQGRARTNQPFAHRLLSALVVAASTIACDPHEAVNTSSEVDAGGSLSIITATELSPAIRSSSVVEADIAGDSGAGYRGLDGEIFKVTNLNDTGPGSLRAALAVGRPRLIVFEVGGRIRLRSDLTVRSPNVTVAGQTAPSPGITLTGATLSIKTHGVGIEHLRIRVGDRKGPRRDDRDGIRIAGKPDGQRPVYDVLIDHCSVSWAIDEGISLWFPGVRDVTVSNSIVSETLSNAGHSKGRHSMGLLVGPDITGVTISRNLLAHNRWRNPVITPGAEAAVVNNLVYNYGGKGHSLLCRTGRPSDLRQRRRQPRLGGPVHGQEARPGKVLPLALAAQSRLESLPS